MFTNLFLFLSLLAFAGDSSGNGGNVYEGHIQRISAKQLFPALDHEKNAGLLTDMEKKTMKALLNSKVPFKVVKRERLEAGRYFELDGKEAKDFSPGATRIVKDKTSRKIIVQWDEADVKESTLSGTIFDHLFAQKIFEKSINYAYITGGVEIDDKAAAKLASRLYVPPSSEYLLLPSSEYRYDIHRRVKELAGLHEKAISLAKLRRRPQAEIVDFQSKITGLQQLLTYKFANDDEDMASNLDLTERIIRQDLQELQGK